MDVSFLLNRLDRKRHLGCFSGISWAFISVCYYLIKKSASCSKMILNYDISCHRDGKISVTFTFQMEILHVYP